VIKIELDCPFCKQLLIATYKSLKINSGVWIDKECTNPHCKKMIRLKFEQEDITEEA